MQKNCTRCDQHFEVTDKDLDMLKKLSPVVGKKSLDLPAPTRCPDCRQQRRISFRNDKNYYKNTCHFCKKNIISIYSPDKNLPVVCAECFWSDQWDAGTFGKDIDWKRPFFEQYGEMRKAVPRLSIFNTQSDNAEYTVHSSKNKNCYMCSSAVGSEDTYFSDWPIDCRDCSDILMSPKMELCYACNDSRECFNGDWLQLCSNVTDSLLCFDCHGSQDLAGCVSQRNKNGMILNEKATKAEVQEAIRKYKTDRAFRKDFDAKFSALLQKVPKREAWNINATGCSGNYIMNAQNAQHCYNVVDAQDCRYAYDAIKQRDVMDLMRGSGGEVLYDCKGIIDLKYSAFCNLTYQCDNLLYCDNCHGSSSCFGCFGLRKKKYCILNKQYTREEYEALVPKLVEHMKKDGEWGEFFPISLSPFGYNETKAFDWYPLTKAEALKRGYAWSDYEQSLPTGLKSIEGAQLPDDIANIPDDILNYVISCEVTKKPYRLIPQELAFYRKKGLPVPRRCPQQRLKDLEALQNPRELHDRNCDKCKKAIRTTYSPDRPEKVYCEECFLKEVY
jgi:hypothetical protein